MQNHNSLPQRLRLVDRRQQRTLKALHAALDRLIARVPYKQITVSIISTEAGVGRPAFYRLFEDLDGLIVDRLHHDLEDQWLFAENCMATGMTITAMRHATAAFAFDRIYTQPQIYHALLSGAAGANAVTIFRDQISRLLGLQARSNVEAKPSERNLAIGMAAGAISGFMLSWIEQGLTPPPASAALMLEQMVAPIS